MSDINPLGASSYYGGLQNATSQAAKDAKKEKTSSASRVSFTKLLKTNSETEEQHHLQELGYPPQIAGMSIEDAAIFLKDAVDSAGNKLSVSASTQNIAEFRDSVRMFIKYIVENNYIEHKKERRGKIALPMQRFSKFNDRSRPADPRVIIQTINEKLDALVRDTLLTQSSNMKILERANEIRGLIVDLIQA